MSLFKQWHNMQNLRHFYPTLSKSPLGCQSQRCFSNYSRNKGSNRRSVKSKNHQYERDSRRTIPTGRPVLNGDGLYGIHSVKASLVHRSRGAYHALYIQDSIADSSQPLRQIQQNCRRMGIEVKYETRQQLDIMSGDRPHQGVILDCTPAEMSVVSAKQLVLNSNMVLRKSPNIIVVLDQIVDPQNLGSILRTASFLGCDRVVQNKRGGAPLTPVASKSSAGALEEFVGHNSLNFPDSPMHEFLRECTGLGWDVVGLALQPEAIPLFDLKLNENGNVGSSLNSTVLERSGTGRIGNNVICVLGNEGSGIRRNILDCCTQLVTIPNQETAGEHRTGPSLISSLNVGVAFAMVTWHLRNLFHAGE